MKNLQKAFVACLEQILGEDCYVPSPTPSRLKSGKPVYRLAGTYGLSISRDGKITYHRQWHDGQYREIEITRDNYQDQTFPYAWEFLVLERGQEQVASLLRDALATLGYLVDVSVGAGRSDYASSIVVRPLAGQIPRPTSPDEIGELEAIGNELIAAGFTLDNLGVRLRNLLLTVGRKLP